MAAAARPSCLETTVFPWNPYFCRKLNFPERPVTVTTFWADGTTAKVSEESIKRDLARRLLDKLSLKELNELNSATTHSPSTSEREIACSARSTCSAITQLPHIGRRYDPSSGELVTGEADPAPE